ncbi:hypothetical protein DRH27_02425 [Candidatus Falkowbacteria bacterium]|nr:MAG: hypothetical protein DRH27_02425 [Candidatus Falkowbacteria bacterium]
MEKQYSLEKASSEAKRIKKIAGENSSSEDIKIADKIISDEKKGVILKLREDLKSLIDPSILVINAEKSTTELADIMIDAYSKNVNEVRDYLHSEKNIEIVREERKNPQFPGVLFYIKIKTE